MTGGRRRALRRPRLWRPLRWRFGRRRPRPAVRVERPPEIVPGCPARVLADWHPAAGRVVTVRAVTSDWDGDWALFDAPVPDEEHPVRRGALRHRRCALRFDCRPPEIARVAGPVDRSLADVRDRRPGQGRTGGRP